MEENKLIKGKTKQTNKTADKTSHIEYKAKKIT